MKNYTLSFIAKGKPIIISAKAEVVYGLSSLSYKPLVDDKISKWLQTNRIDDKSINLLDVVLTNESQQQVFNQKNWFDYTTIEHKDFDEKSNSDLIELEHDKLV